MTGTTARKLTNYLRKQKCGLFHVKHWSINTNTNTKESKTMEKRWTNVTINGVDFELDTKEVVDNPIVFYKSVYDVYGCCSDTKRAIWEEWARWFMERNSTMFGVTSHNSNFFTISGCITGDDANEYYVVITAKHNRAWRVHRSVA